MARRICPESENCSDWNWCPTPRMERCLFRPKSARFLGKCRAWIVVWALNFWADQHYSWDRDNMSLLFRDLESQRRFWPAQTVNLITQRREAMNRLSKAICARSAINCYYLKRPDYLNHRQWKSKKIFLLFVT